MNTIKDELEKLPQEVLEIRTLTPNFIKNHPDKTLKEVFKDLFKVELKVGKWYKNPSRKALMFFEKLTGNNVFGYGFNNAGVWEDKLEYLTNNWKEATNEEVCNALISEAINKKLINGMYIKILGGYHNGNISEVPLGIEYCYTLGTLYNNGYVLFHNGIWTSPVQEITQKEAEKQLGRK